MMDGDRGNAGNVIELSVIFDRSYFVTHLEFICVHVFLLVPSIPSFSFWATKSLILNFIKHPKQLVWIQRIREVMIIFILDIKFLWPFLRFKMVKIISLISLFFSLCPCNYARCSWLLSKESLLAIYICCDWNNSFLCHLWGHVRDNQI